MRNCTEAAVCLQCKPSVPSAWYSHPSSGYSTQDRCKKPSALAHPTRITHPLLPQTMRVPKQLWPDAESDWLTAWWSCLAAAAAGKPQPAGASVQTSPRSMLLHMLMPCYRILTQRPANEPLLMMMFSIDCWVLVRRYSCAKLSACQATFGLPVM